MKKIKTKKEICLDFNNFKLRGYVPNIVWEAYATLTCYRIGGKAGSLKQLSQAWDGLKELGCHYVDRKKIIKSILKSRWMKAQDALTENARLVYTPALAGRPEKVSLETKNGTFDVPFKKWTHGLIGNLEEDTYFEVIVLEPAVLLPILLEHGVYNKSFVGNEHVLLTIIDDAV